MRSFTFKAKKGPGNDIEGTIESETETSAVNKLISSGYSPIWIREEVMDSGKFTERVTSSAVADFTHQLSSLVDSGLTLYDSLLVIESHARALKSVVRSIKGNIKKGKAFSESLGSHPGIFSELYISLVRSGEEGGMLNGALSSLSELLEKREDTKAQIINAVLYPMLMAVVGIVTICVLMIFVIPRLTGMFIEMGQALPLPTRILICFSGFAGDWWFLPGVFISGLLFLYIRGHKTTAFRTRISSGRSVRTIDRLTLKLPLIGCFLRSVELERFARIASTLLKNGVSMLRSLRIASDTISNEAIKMDLAGVYDDVASGLPLSGAMRKSRYCGSYMADMAAIGEKGGSLDRALLKVAESYETDNDRKVKRFVSLLEPLMILVMGAILGFVVISMLLPVFQISMSVQ